MCTLCCGMPGMDPEELLYEYGIEAGMYSDEDDSYHSYDDYEDFDGDYFNDYY